MQNKNKIILKIAISFALLSFILLKVDWTDFSNNIKSINIELYLFSVFLAFLDPSLNALKWKLLLKAKGIDISQGKSLSFMLVGMFFGLFIPTTLGGDIARMYDFSKYSSKKIETISSIFLERLSGGLSLAVMVLFIIFFYHPNVDHQILMLVLCISVFLFTFFIFNNTLNKKLFNLFPSTKILQFKKSIEDFFSSINNYKKHKTLLVNIFLLSFLVNLLRIIVIFLFSKAIGLDIHFLYFFLFIPLTIFIMMIPISFAGIGVREGAYFFFFSKVGMDASDTVLISWMSHSIILFLAIIGGIIFAFRKH